MDFVRWPVPGEAGAHWQARAFGGALADLDLDLDHGSPPMATTRVLAGCLEADGAAPDEMEIWGWTVNRRLQGLLAVTVATRGEAWTPTITCDACTAAMDLPLALGAFRRESDPLAVACDLGGETVEVAMPTGADQRAWLAAGDDAPAAMLARLLPDAADDRLPAVEAALAEADPLTVLEIETRCPECDAENRLELDLEAICLALLAAARPRLIDDIHALAMAYHWTEAEILAVPPERRRLYLDRIGGWSPGGWSP